MATPGQSHGFLVVLPGGRVVEFKVPEKGIDIID
jgi:hypothetical protein